MKTFAKLMLVVALALCGAAASGQGDYDFYKQKANEYLAKGDGEGAQRSYSVWKELTGKRDPDMEARIEACKKGKTPAQQPNSVPDGVLIDGIVWATRNVASPGTFAAKPEDPGMFYQWNSRKGWPATGNVTGWNTSGATSTVWSAANDPCPSGWRVPTKEELDRLINTGSAWVTVNNIKGRSFGSGSNTVFFPAAGGRFHSNGGFFNDKENTIGGYWTGSSFSSATTSYMWALRFSNTEMRQIGSYPQYGFPVRCIRR